MTNPASSASVPQFAEHVQRALQAQARRTLAAALAPLPGAKALLVDDSLFDPVLSHARTLDLFTDDAFLHEHGIRKVALLSAHAAHPIADVSAQPGLVFLIRGVNAAAAAHAATVMRRLQEQHHASTSTTPTTSTTTPTATTASIIPSTATTASTTTTAAGAAGATTSNTSNSAAATRPPSTTFSDPATAKCLVLTIPRRSLLVERVLRKASLSHVSQAVLPLGFLPFDADLITLDWPAAYRQVVLDGDNSALLATAAALSSLATSLNLDFAAIRSAGAAATAVAEELLETHGQMYPPARAGGGPTSSNPSSAQSSPVLAPRPAPDHPFFAGVGGGGGLDGGDPAASTEGMTLAEAFGKASRRRPVTLVLIDRGVDVVTPLLTQWTYEGLLDEAIGLRNNVMDLPVSAIESEDAMSYLHSSNSSAASVTGSLRKRLRGDVDRIFAQLRDLNYWTAAREIGNVASSVKDYYAKRPARETDELAKVKDYVKGLREVKSEHASATTHTMILSEISARTFDSAEFKQRFEMERDMLEGNSAKARDVYIGDALARGVRLSQVLRLACLWSLTSSGVDSKALDFIRREVLASCGLSVLPLLANLERAGMLVQSTRETAVGNLSWIPLPNFGGGAAAANRGGAGSSATGSGGTRPGIMGSITAAAGNSSPAPSVRSSFATRTGGSSARSVVSRPGDGAMSTNGSDSGGGGGGGGGMDFDTISRGWSVASSAGGSDEGSVRTGRFGQARGPGSVAGSVSGRTGGADYSWQFARAALRLVTEFDPEKVVQAGSSDAVSSPYSGYTPLTVRLAEAGVGLDGWGSLPPIVGHTALLPPGHATVEHRTGGLRDDFDGDDGVAGHSVAGAGVEREGIDAIIVMVGGIARAEASALRLAAAARGVRAIIATTAVVGADEFVMSLDEVGQM